MSLTDFGVSEAASAVIGARTNPADSSGLVKATVVSINWAAHTIACNVGGDPNNFSDYIPLLSSCCPVVGGAVWLATVGDTFLAISAPIDNWHAPTFAGAWANFGGTYAKAGYRLEAPDIVRIVGLVKSGTGNIFTLPVGYRPTGNHMIATDGNDAFAAFDVMATGAVTMRIGSGTSWLSLACTFSLSAPQ
jgi:hypothetical protein